MNAWIIPAPAHTLHALGARERWRSHETTTMTIRARPQASECERCSFINSLSRSLSQRHLAQARPIQDYEGRGDAHRCSGHRDDGARARGFELANDPDFVPRDDFGADLVDIFFRLWSWGGGPGNAGRLLAVSFTVVIEAFSPPNFLGPRPSRPVVKS